MSGVIYVSPAIHRDRILQATQGGEYSVEPIASATTAPGPKVFVVDQTYLDQNGNSLLRRALGIFLVLERESDLNRFEFPEDAIVDYSIAELNPVKLRQFLRATKINLQMRRERDSHLKRLKELNKIGVALSTVRDPVTLFNMILQKSREITFADAGSLYLVEGEEESAKRLRFKISQCDSMTLNYEEFVMPITKGSIAGYVAATGGTLNIPDVYQIDPAQEYKFNRNFDEKTGYRTVSTLAVPMTNHKNEIIAIIQLINRKKNFGEKISRENYTEITQAFDQNDEDLVSSLASQAAISLENNILIKSIERLFEGFVTAAVTAIESRDPTTSGHSFRVADLTVGLADIVDRQQNGKFGAVQFTPDEVKEIRYAALLHDFGKVGVRENVLVKAKKLYPMQMDLIRERFRYLKKAWESEYYKSRVNLFQAQGQTEGSEIEEIYRKRMDSLEEYLQFILQANEPSVLAQGNFEKLLRIAAETDLIPPGDDLNILTPEEVQLLSIRKGSLNDRERVEIESHVTHTFLFLSKIPWTSELKRVPRIAYGHHEKLNGNGYPNRLRAEDIAIQTRMMTISDIYDALTASDRPYKKAVPYEKALDIISQEVKAGMVDNDLFELFLDAKIWKMTTGK